MQPSRGSLWAIWAACVALLGLELALPALLPLRADPWYPAQTAVAGFVLTLLALLAGVGSFTLRETLAAREVRLGTLDPNTPEGFARVRAMLIVLWVLCLVIGLLGSLLAFGAASPRAAWPWALAAGGLLAWHAPRGWLFRGPPAGAAEAR